jgi:hypothetical protein
MPAHKKQKTHATPVAKKEDKKEKREPEFVEPFSPGLFIMVRFPSLHNIFLIIDCFKQGKMEC